MAQQTIDIGAAPNDGTGDPIRDAFDKCNDNFTELYGSLAGLLDFQGATDCSTNPNYPAASQGDIYIVSVAGKIGGASGKVVEVGDFYLALADNAGGTEASVGTSWAVLQANITGGSVISELDDIPDVNAPTPANGDVLTWDSTPGEWVPAAPTGGSNALDDLTDVNAPTPSDGDVLTFDSGSGDWVNQAPSGGTGGGFQLIETLNPSAASTIDCTDFDGLGYTDIQVVFDLVFSTDGSNLTCQFKLNGAFKNAASYRYGTYAMSSSGSVGAAANGSGTTSMVIGGAGATWGIGNASPEAFNVTATINNIDSANQKSVAVSGSHNSPSGHRLALFGAGAYEGTDYGSTLEALRFAASSGTFTGTIRIFAR